MYAVASRTTAAMMLMAAMAQRCGSICGAQPARIPALAPTAMTTKMAVYAAAARRCMSGGSSPCDKTVTFPVAAPGGDHPTVLSHQCSNGWGMKPRVLIVDDSQYTVDMLRDILDDEFEIVGETGNGDDAVDLYEELDPDLVVMDLVISGTNGVQATARIKQQDPDSKVLILTSVDNRAKRRQAADAGADDYMKKPFDPEDLVESLQAIEEL